jgi:hypothetical protein
MASKKDEDYILKMQQKLGCDDATCSTHFVFTVMEADLTAGNDFKRIYNGRCTKCSRYLKLTTAGMEKFKRLMGDTQVTITKSNFNQLFQVGGNSDIDV